MLGYASLVHWSDKEFYLIFEKFVIETSGSVIRIMKCHSENYAEYPKISPTIQEILINTVTLNMNQPKSAKTLHQTFHL